MSEANLRKGNDPESFIILFTCAFEDFVVRGSERIIVMMSQISDELAHIYAQMSLDLVRDFEEFKKLVFLRLGISAEHLRQKYRALTKNPQESYSQLGANLMKYLDKWLQQEGIESVQDIKNITGLKQFYSLLPGDLKYLVRDKNPKDVQEAGERNRKSKILFHLYETHVFLR